MQNATSNITCIEAWKDWCSRKLLNILMYFPQPAWLSVDFDNWRDWEHEEEDGMAEYEQYMDVSTFPNLCMSRQQHLSFTLNN